MKTILTYGCALRNEVITVNEVKALAKGLQILDQLLEANMRPEDSRSIGVTEAADMLSVNKSSASRLLQTLSHYGYVEREGYSRGYVLGPKMSNALSANSKTILRDMARPFLFQLMKLTGESAHTAIATQGQALIIDDVESDSSLKVSGGIGRLVDLHCTAVGKCLLAFTALTIPKDLPKCTPQTLSNHHQLRCHLEEIRQKGYALDDEENIEGVRCLATPVYNEAGMAIACIGISGPSIRMTSERIPEFAHFVLEASKELSHSLGYRS